MHCNFTTGGAIFSSQQLINLRTLYGIEISDTYGTTELGGILENGLPVRNVGVTVLLIYFLDFFLFLLIFNSDCR
jgi:acyl-coenzyme A synthetase/AMP-(fatty) acid ligase